MFAMYWKNTLSKGVELDISIIVPVYNNEQTLERLLVDLDLIQKSFLGNLEVIFVIDGSTDKSLVMLEKQIKVVDFKHKLIQLSRNFGSFEAIRCGMQYAQGRFIIVKSADLQESNQLIQDFYVLLDSGDFDIVFGRRASREDGFVRDKFSKSYWFIYRKFINSEIPVGGVDIFGCTRNVANLISQFSEKNSSLLGLLYWIGFKRGYVDYNREKSLNPKGSWSLSKKIKYAFDSIFSFTGMPIVLKQSIGLIGILASFIVSIIVIFLRLNGTIIVPGYTALMIVTLFSMSTILFAIGIVGSYAWRAFENTKQRPAPIVWKIKDD
jgi:glycosyltransferase involved in cell wall biosynthesis